MSTTSARYKRQSSSSSRLSRSSVSSGSSSGSGSFGNGSAFSSGMGSKGRYGGSLIGSSSFQVGRERDRSAEMEFFSRDRKPRSYFRRPSSLGFSRNPLPDKSEAKLQFQPKPSSRGHIVPKIKDNLRPQGSFQKESEVTASYRNLSPARPHIHKLNDHLKPEGLIALKSETSVQYENKKPQRPVIHKLKDHQEQVQPKGEMMKNSEYSNNFAKISKGDRVAPTWVSNFEKVTVDGSDTGR